MPGAKDPFRYLAGYEPKLVADVRDLIAEGELGAYVARRHPLAHDRVSNRQLFDYVKDLKRHHLRTAPPIAKAWYDDRLMAAENALGLHTFKSTPHGGKLRAKSEIRIASVFKTAPEALLRMICVHELAHLREKEHTKAFYRMCEAMEPEYHALELDARLYLMARELGQGSD